jgi:hypothetical protein
MAIDRTKDKEKFNIMMRSWIEQFAHVLASTDIKQHIQMLVIEPFMNYIIERIFPYMLIAISLFVIVFLCVVLTFIFLMLNRNKQSFFCPFCEKTIKGF